MDSGAFETAKRELLKHALEIINRLGPNPQGPPGEYFHYTTGSALIKILQSKVLWASDLMCLNDRTEWRYGMRLVHEISMKRKDEISAGLAETLDQLSKEDFGLGKSVVPCVACFCVEKDLLSQWRGYANAGGVSIGFRRDSMLETCEANHLLFCGMIYDRSVQGVVVDEVINKANQLLGTGWNDPEVRDLLLRLLVFVFGYCASRFKDPAFREEHEWRLIWRATSSTDQRFRFRDSAGHVVPYIEIPFQTTSISRIVLGPRFGSEIDELMLRRMLEFEGFSATTVERSVVPLV